MNQSVQSTVVAGQERALPRPGWTLMTCLQSQGWLAMQRRRSASLLTVLAMTFAGFVALPAPAAVAALAPLEAWRGWVSIATRSAPDKPTDAGGFQDLNFNIWTDIDPLSRAVTWRHDTQRYGVTYSGNCKVESVTSGSGTGTGTSNPAQPTSASAVQLPPTEPLFGDPDRVLLGFQGVLAGEYNHTSTVSSSCFPPDTFTNSSTPFTWLVGARVDDPYNARSARDAYTYRPGGSQNIYDAQVVICMTTSSADADADGMPDDVDVAPTTPGSAENLGGAVRPNPDLTTGAITGTPQCPDVTPGVVTDRDFDGIPDSADYCPDDVGSATLSGCPGFDLTATTAHIGFAPAFRGGDTVEVTPQLSGGSLSWLGTLCITTTWSATVAHPRSTAPVHWNGAPAQALEGVQIARTLPVKTVGPLEVPKYPNGVYVETITLRTCGPPTRLLATDIHSVTPLTGALTGVSHTTTAQAYRTDGALVGSVTLPSVSTGKKLIVAWTEQSSTGVY